MSTAATILSKSRTVSISASPMRSTWEPATNRVLDDCRDVCMYPPQAVTRATSHALQTCRSSSTFDRIPWNGPEVSDAAEPSFQSPAHLQPAVLPLQVCFELPATPMSPAHGTEPPPFSSSVFSKIFIQGRSCTRGVTRSLACLYGPLPASNGSPLPLPMPPASRAFCPLRPELAPQSPEELLQSLDSPQATSASRILLSSARPYIMEVESSQSKRARRIEASSVPPTLAADEMQAADSESCYSYDSQDSDYDTEAAEEGDELLVDLAGNPPPPVSPNGRSTAPGLPLAPARPTRPMGRFWGFSRLSQDWHGRKLHLDLGTV